jgi:hypothetical protein
VPQLLFTLKYNVADGLVFSASTLISEYMHGIPLTDSSGRSYSVANIKQRIREVTVSVENFLFIKVVPVMLTERQDFIEEEWRSWASMKTGYRINQLISVKGKLAEQTVLELLPSMFTIKGRNLAFVPNGSTIGSLVIGVGGNLILLRAGSRIVPNFWEIVYTSGFTEIPLDILAVIGKLAAIQMFAVLGDLVLGAGIANQSLSIDGLSQSIGTTISAGNSAYSARIKQYTDELRLDNIPGIKDRYRGITFEVI